MSVTISGEEEVPLTEKTSSTTRLSVCGHLPQLVGVGGQRR